ncbi:MAG: hypothetical protein K2X02_03675 [Alphaproteobacteria bacterium]|nr:hypothetical protein [Alphaproteobacteria bacterium]
MSLRSYLFGLCFLLGGCALPSDRVRCPKAAILAEFSKTIDRIEGVPIRTELDSLIPECTQDNAYTYVTFRLRTTSFRPMSSLKMPLTVQTSYFVAVIDEKGTVLSRSDHDLEITFASDQTTKVNFIQVQEKIPTQKKAAIYVGFNLDEFQFEQLQKERNKTFISAQ